jgi:VanZ family protein
MSATQRPASEKPPEPSPSPSVRPLLWAIAPFVLGTLLYMVLVAPHSYHLSDDGWILAMAYRIVQGDIPYRDFLFAFPPSSPFLHTVWMLLPDGMQFIAARCGFYLAFLAVPATLFTLTYDRCFPGRQGLAASACLTLVAWVYALHNFPPMPWPTVDGLWLSTLALGLLIASVSSTGRRKAIYCLSAGTLAGVATLTKQSYAPFLAFFEVAALFACSSRDPDGRIRIDLANAVRLIASSLAPLAVFVVYLEYHSLLSDAVGQIVGVATSKGLQAAVIEPYQMGRYARHSQQFAWYGFYLACIGSIERRIAGIELRTVPYLFFLGHLLWTLYHFAEFGGIYSAYALFAAAVVFILTRLAFLAVQGRLSRELALLCVGTVVIAFSTQISWGYHVPLMGFAGVGFALAALSAPQAEPGGARRLALTYAVPGALALYLGITLSTAVPYRDAPVAEQHGDLSHLSDRFLPGFTTGEANYRYMEALMTLSDTVERDFPDRRPVIITESPLYYFLRHRHNPSSIDWWLPEQSARYAGRLMQELKRPDVVVIVRRDFVPNPTDPRNRFLEFIRRRGQVVRSQGAYDAYVVPAVAQR